MPKMPLAITGFAALIVAVLLLTLTPSSAPSLLDSDPLIVEASFYPLAEFARQVGGDLITVGTITPGGIEPHEYQPTSRAITAIYGADVFLWNGDGLDVWAEAIAPEVAAKGVISVKMSAMVDSRYDDPHFWLDPAIAIQAVNAIRDTLSAIDPTRAETFTKNAATYSQQLSQLDADYRAGLTRCDNRVVVTPHAAFTYLANEYQFDVIPITGLSPEEEPSAGRLSAIAELAKEKNIKYIYFETLVSPKLAQTIADEIGAQTLVLNPIEGLTNEDIAAGKNYLSIMRENLTNLKTGMLCQ